MDQVLMEGLSPRSVSGAPDDDGPITDANAGLLATALKLEVVKSRLTDRKQENSCQAPLTVYTVTWNLNGKMPPHRLPELLGIGPSTEYCDMYVIGIQEAPSIGIEHQVLATLGKDYVKLIHSSLASIHLTLFVKKELVSKILDIHTDKVATGVAAFFGNKGGVGIAFTYLGTTFLFVTCHLAAHQDSVLERNDQFGRISRALFVKERDWARRVNQERSRPSSPRSPKALKPPAFSVATALPSEALLTSKPAAPVPSFPSQSSSMLPQSGPASPRSAQSSDFFRQSGRDGLPGWNLEGRSLTGDRKTEIQPGSLGSSPLNPHFTPGQLSQRNGMTAQSNSGSVPPASSTSMEQALKPHAADDFDVIIWSGDVNYRVEGNRRVADAALAQNMVEVLRANDQLLREKKAGNAFQGYEEGELLFRPTYKFDGQSQRYDSSSKARIPSWTDRILYRSRHTGQNLAAKLESYGSVESLTTSDHRPVYARFSISTRPSRRSASSVSESKEKQHLANVHETLE